MSQVITPMQPNVLVVPLDWGLGHATRCIPIIKTLLRRGCTVLLAGEGKTKNLLQKEFPQLIFLPLEGYRIAYSKSKWRLPFTIGVQIPKILKVIQKEHAWLQNVVKEYQIHAVISDNRYGLYHRAIPSVFMTHQLCIKTAFGKKVDSILRKLNYRYLSQFSECWIPDVEGNANLAGALSHPARLPAVPIKYLGLLSRFRSLPGESPKHILILLSGPEPQRTILENLLLAQLKTYKGPVVLVRGLPGQVEEISTSSNIFVHNHLTTEKLNEKMLEASVVISRCGYSTLMDLVALQKKSILIATPGQSEQEYLARHVMKHRFALCIEQRKFQLRAALDLSVSFNYQLPRFNTGQGLEDAITDLLNQIKNEKANPDENNY